MRIFLTLLILAISFSGYAAAAHAAGQDMCHPETQAQLTDCDGHQAVQSDDDQSGSAAGQCLDCAHCCVSHVMTMSDHVMSFPVQVAVFNASAVDDPAGDVLFSLLRPPKSLV